jgi:hypothetical protein
MPDDPARDKSELLKGLDDAEQEAKRIEAQAKNMMQNARLIVDAAPQLRVLYGDMPVTALPPGEWSRQNLNVKEWLSVAKAMAPSPTDVSSFGAMSLGVANTAASGVMPFVQPILAQPSAMPAGCSSPVVQLAAHNLVAVIEKYPSVDEARKEMRRLSLDSRGGSSKTALELLEDAQLSLDMPVASDGGAGSLIGIRECINACLAELLRRRPRQEDTGGHKEKIVSIGNQCARGTLGSQHFENLGVEAKTLNGLLSGAKQNALSRSAVQLLFRRAVLFLASFLGSIDEAKLR